MVFDLVHSLGVERGAFETNVLALFPLGDRDSRPVDWAPEVEYAVADDVALEFELPFEDSDLEAWKAALQFSHAQSTERGIAHGSQFIVEKFDGKSAWEWTGLYLYGRSLAPNWQTLVMLGARATTGSDVQNQVEALANFNVFRTLNERWLFGFETNVAVDPGDDWRLLLFPQLHFELSEHLDIQFGAGVEIVEDESDPLAGFRLIYSTQR